jgi:hypothetical protein
MKGKPMNDFDPDREWTPDEEQYYLENPDEWPDAPEGWPEDEPDDDWVDDADDWYHDLDPWGVEDDDEWVVDRLASMDERGDFI